MIDELTQALLKLKDAKMQKCTILMTHSAILDGLVKTGIPQINIDQLNNFHSLVSVDVMTQEHFNIGLATYHDASMSWSTRAES